MKNFHIKSEGGKFCKKYKFAYLSKKEFEYKRKLAEEAGGENCFNVLGSTSLKGVKKKDLKENESYLEVPDPRHPGQTVFLEIKKVSPKYASSYIQISDTEFIVYRRRFPIYFTAAVAAVAVPAAVIFFLNRTPENKINLADALSINLSDENSRQLQYYDFQTFGEYHVSTASPEIKVWNPESNTRIFQYDIYVDDVLIKKTDGILPGNMVLVDCSSILEQKGEHELRLGLSVIHEQTKEIVGKATRAAVLIVSD